jgi:excisionase family DNA binding protein
LSARNKAKAEEVVQRDSRFRSFKATKPEQQKAPPLDLSNRLGLRPREVARVLGISERLVRQILPELPHTRIGSAVVVPKDLLAEWLRNRACRRETEVKIVVDEVVTALKEKR